jgi:mannosyltransferase OCH1-like enzyme
MVVIPLLGFLLAFVVLLVMYNRQFNSEKIPKIIHQTAPSDTSKWNPVWFDCQESWKSLHPDFEYRMWTDEDLDEFMKTEYPDFYERVFSKYDVKIKKIDSARYFILYKYGGVYADMDYKCQHRFFESLPNGRVSIARSKVDFDGGFQNALMISPKGHPFWEDVFVLLEERKDEPDVILCTGPRIISDCAKTKRIHGLSTTMYNPYFNHWEDSSDNYPDAKTIHMHTYSWSEEDKKYKNIYAIPVNQLGNCLRHIISMKILADFCNRPFKIDLSNVHSKKENEILRLLFEEYIEENPEYTYYNQEDICYVDSLTNTSPTVESHFTNIPNETFGTSSIYSIKLNKMSTNEFLKKKIEIYKNLNWPKFNIPDLKNLIGVHIRFTDNLHDPSKNSLNTPKDVFFKKIETIQKPFLLCSDNKVIIDEIKTKYKNDVILPEKISDENLQPLYEMFLLSRTKHIIGSYASTFSYESSFFRGTNLEVFENNTWKIYEMENICSK